MEFKFLTRHCVCIMQSNFLPWKGYFDLIRYSDLFVFLDNVQYSRRNWRNRNAIKTPSGLKWLTIPVSFSLSKRTPIDRIQISDRNWLKKHLGSIKQNYRRAPFFEETIAWLEPLLLETTDMDTLSDVNHFLIKDISTRLGFGTKFASSTELLPTDVLNSFRHNADLIVQLTKAAGGEMCLNGPAAKPFTDTGYCKANGISLIWANYSGYPKYPQLHGEFRHDVSIIDMFMMLGPDTHSYLNNNGFIES